MVAWSKLVRALSLALTLIHWMSDSELLRGPLVHCQGRHALAEDSVVTDPEKMNPDAPVNGAEMEKTDILLVWVSRLPPARLR